MPVIKTITPVSVTLQKYIECFYLYSGEVDDTFCYWAFPHYNTGLSFFKGVSIDRKERSVEIANCGNDHVTIEVLGKYTYPVMVRYTGNVQEVSIVFKPLGLNRFFRDSYQAIAPGFSQPLSNNEWTAFGEKLFSEKESIGILETFLLSQLSENSDFGPIESSLSVLGNIDDDKSVAALALRLGYNVKTFQRLFRKHMGCTPVEYRRICRFRQSMVNKLDSPHLKTLTDLTYEGGYFDQSYFIKEFRKLTNHNPKDFFKVVGKVAGDVLVWEIR